jgi:hypothetical protein
VTLWPAGGGSGRPPTSSVNASKGQSVANAAWVPLGAGDAFNAYNSGGRTDLVVDVSGAFEYYPALNSDGLSSASTARIATFSTVRTSHWLSRALPGSAGSGRSAGR